MGLTLKIPCRSPEKYLKNEIYRFSTIDFIKGNQVFKNLNTVIHGLHIILRDKYPFSNLACRN